GMAFLGSLLKTARAGDPVRLMTDASGDAFGLKGFTQTWRGQDYLQELVGTGNAQVRVYHPIHKKILKGSFSRGPMSSISANHDKLIVSKDLAMTGGRNVSKDYFVDPKDRADVYRDCDAVVQGEQIANALRAGFEHEFDDVQLHYQVVPDMFGNWVKRDIELLGAHLMMDTWLNDAKPLSEAEKTALRTSPEARERQAAELLERALARLGEVGVDRAPSKSDRSSLMKHALELAGYPELHGAYRGYDIQQGMHHDVELKALDRTSAAVGEVDDIGKSLIQLATSAKERILLQNPYVVLTNDAIAALKAAGERGVKIELVTNSPASSDSALTQAFFLEDWPKLLATIPNLRIFTFTGQQKLHAKVAAADDEIAAVTSFNLDLLSAKSNGEIGVAAYSRGLTKDLRDAVARDFADPAQKVVEYTIQRDAAGKPVLDDKGDPIVTFGAEHHVSPKLWNKYKALRWIVRHARQLPAFEPIAR
ncbi:MAG: phospholipase D-like domain-containing protein, partial [Burkholderiaceae bacterium]|nr:phospholipase D-like domain-containing protein [Burkholderiaceae bacterium]